MQSMTINLSTRPTSFGRHGRTNAAIASCLAVGVLGLRALANAPTIATFDALGAGTGAGQGTFAFGISPAGAIEGQYLDGNNVYHGFVRSVDGVITTFDVPQAGSSAFQGTQPFSINPAGAITGYYTDRAGLSHGFVRSPEGDIATFDAPGASLGGCSPPLICSTGTQGASINPSGAISGQFVDANGNFHGFLRSPNGVITTFDAPNAGTGAGEGTFVTFTDGINPAGAVAGGYVDVNGVFRAFVRDPDGTITSFDAPGAVNGENNSGINPRGTVTSYYVDGNSVLHGYVRAADGALRLFDVPGSGSGPGQGTLPLNINAPGDIAGAFIDSRNVYQGFLRLTTGSLTTFALPGAGTGAGQGTIPACNNPSDVISGFYIDSGNVAHGFMVTP